MPIISSKSHDLVYPNYKACLIQVQLVFFQARCTKIQTQFVSAGFYPIGDTLDLTLMDLNFKFIKMIPKAKLTNCLLRVATNMTAQGHVFGGNRDEVEMGSF